MKILATALRVILYLVWPSDCPIPVSYNATLTDVGYSFLSWLRYAWDDYVQQPHINNYRFVRLIPQAIALVRDVLSLAELLIKIQTPAEAGNLSLISFHAYSFRPSYEVITIHTISRNRFLEPHKR